MGVTVKERGGVWFVIAEQNGRTVEKEFPTKKQADTIAAGLRAELKQTAPKLPFKAFAKDYLEHIKATRKSQTYRGYESIFRVHLLPAFGDRELTDIKRRDIKDFIKAKLKEKTKSGKRIKPSRVQRIKACLTGIFTHAIDEELMDANPAKGLEKLITDRKQSREIPEPYSPEDLFVYLETIRASHPREYPLFLTLARTGMRLGEALGLKWPDIIFDRKWLLIRRTLTEQKKEEPPKSGKARGVDMSDELMETLKDHRASMKTEFKRLPEWVFVNRRGNPMDRGNLTNRVHLPAIKKAGLRRIRIHDIRHTYGTIRLISGHTEGDITAQMGHASAEFTKDVYGHFKPGRFRDEINQLDRLGKPPTEPAGGEEEGGEE